MIELKSDNNLDNMANNFIENIQNGIFEKMVLKKEGNFEISKNAMKNFELWIERAMK